MKFKSKTFTIVLSTISVLGVIGGGVMLGIGGNVTAPYVDLKTDESPTIVGIGLLNFKSGTYDNTSLGELIQSIKSQSNVLQDQINNYEKTIKVTQDFITFLQERIKEEMSRPIPDAASITNWRNQILSGEITIKDSNEFIDERKALLTAPSMYDLAIGGIVLMSFGILLTFISGILAFSVIKNSKKNKS